MLFDTLTSVFNGVKIIPKCLGSKSPIIAIISQQNSKREPRKKTTYTCIAYVSDVPWKRSSTFVPTF